MKKQPALLLFLLLAVALVLLTCGREGPLPPVNLTPPDVKSTIPIDGTGNTGINGFPIDGSIMITFTLDMDPSTINNKTITVAGAGGIGPIAGSVVYANGSAIFTPAQNFVQNTNYTVTISNVKDIYEVPLASPISINFTTQALPDAAPPSVVSTSPAAGSTGVPVSSGISIAFSKPINSSTLVFQLVSQLSGTVPGGTLTYNGTTAIITPQFSPPAVTMDGSTQYTATVKAGLQDLVGNQLISDYVWTFSTGTGADTAPPIVTQATPTAGSTDVSVTTYLYVTFNKPVNPATAYITLFSMASVTPVIVPFYIEDSYDYNTNILSYKPIASNSLSYNTPYTARVDGVIDLSGNVMPEYTWSFTTGKDGSSTTVSADNNPSQYGSTVTFTSTVTSADSGTTATPTGTVTFKDGTTALPAGTVALAGNTATYAISNLALGVHIISATYNGDSIFSTSTSTLAQTVGQGTTTTTINAPGVTFGSNGVVTVLVSCVSGTPIGNVALSVDGGAVTTQPLTNGSAVFTITKPSVGSHTLSATYAAQGNFQGSANTGTLTVGQEATTTTINAPTITYGADGVVTVTVISTSGTPTGSVSLTWDTGSATQALSTSGSTTFTITGPPAGSHPLSASYAAQGSYLASTASGNLTVNQAPTTMTMSAPAIAYGANGIVTVTVASGILLPTGNVSLVVDNGTPILQALTAGGLNGAGLATFTITTPSAGSHTLSATYAAQGNFLGSGPASGTLGVGSGATTVTISAPTINSGANGAVTVTVSSLSGTPTGTVSLIVDGGAPTTQTLASGSSLFTISVPSAGSHTLSATYATQGNFLGSGPTSGTLIVNPIITVSAGVGGTITPSGSVVVSYNTSTTFTITPTAGYTLASVLVDGVSVGAVTSYAFSSVTKNHTISASFTIDTYAITVTQGSNGTITPGSGLASYGSNTTFTITPNTGYSIASVVVDSVSVGAVTSYTFSNVIAAHTITATFALNTYAITVTQGANGTITPGSGVVSYGSSTTFTITPNTGYSIANVVVDGTSVGVVPSYTFINVIAPHTITATFSNNTYTITVTQGANGTITPGTGVVSYGSSTTYTITPSTGYSITSVLVDGVSAGAVSSYTFSNVTANHTITASFGQNPTITVTQGANGTITPGTGVVSYGSSTTFTITPNTGYSISSVVVDGTSVGAVSSYTFSNVTANHTITASFGQNPTITVTQGTNGTITPGTGVVSYGSSTTFTITPNTGYSISSVVVDGASVGAVTSYTFNNVIIAHTITATFAIDTYTITASAGTGGSITPSGSVVVSYNTSTTFTITPNTGYSIDSVLVDGVSVGAVSSYTFTKVVDVHTITATFVINTYTVSASAGANGSISPASALVSYNSTTTFTVIPATGYSTVVGGTCGGTLNGTTYTTNPITGPCSVTASFTINTYTVTPSAGTNATISPTSPVVVNYDQTTSFTVTQTGGSVFSDSGTCGGTLSGTVSPYTYTTNPITANCTVIPNFN